MKKFIPTLALAALLFSCDMPKEAPSSQEPLNQIVEIVKNRKASLHLQGSLFYKNNFVLRRIQDKI